MKGPLITNRLPRIGAHWCPKKVDVTMMAFTVYSDHYRKNDLPIERFIQHGHETALRRCTIRSFSQNGKKMQRMKIHLNWDHFSDLGGATMVMGHGIGTSVQFVSICCLSCVFGTVQYRMTIDGIIFEYTMFEPLSRHGCPLLLTVIFVQISRRARTVSIGSSLV